MAKKPYTLKNYPFANRGLVTKVDVSQLGEGQFSRFKNLISEQEGSLAVRPGGNLYSFALGSAMHTLKKLKRAAGDRFYVGEGTTIYRGSAFLTAVTSVATSVVTSTAEWSDHKWSSVEYLAGSQANPFLLIAANAKMLKDDGAYSSLNKWGILPPHAPPTGFSITGAAPPDPAPEPYEYAYCYANPVTKAKSNPSVLMLAANYQTFTPPDQSIQMTLAGTGDPQVTGHGSIRIYRRGGNLTDAFRLVGVTTNPGAGSTVNFSDGASDDAIRDAEVAEFDNDPPVTSSLPVALVGKISAITGSGGGGSAAAGAVNRITLSDVPSGFGVFKDVLTVGTPVVIGTGETRERAYIKELPGDSSSWIEVFLQNLHVVYASSGTEVVECGAVSGKPCDLVCQVGDQIFLAGDPNNPGKLYMSKAGRPEAFPFANEVTGVVHELNVGSPSNPIYGIEEMDGHVVCLLRNGIRTVRVWLAAMQEPQRTKAERGLYAKRVFCRVDNEIWYLSHDGIYSWGGGQSRKRTEAIDHVFKRTKTVNGMAPLNYTYAARCTIEFHRNKVYFTYYDTSVVSHGLVYDMLYDRWEPFEVSDGSSSTRAFTAVFSDKEEGIFYTARTVSAQSFIYREESGTSDGHNGSDLTGGTAIEYLMRTASYDLGAANYDKQFGDLMLEITNPDAGSQNVTVKAYYNHSDTADVTDTFTLVAAPGRDRYFLPFQSGSGKQAFACAIEVSGSTTKGLTFHSLGFNYFVLEQAQRGRAFEWDDLGHEFDKRLYQMTIEYDTGGDLITLNLDTINGVKGATQNLAAQQFSLQSGGSGQRAKATFPITDGTIAKMVRLRPSVPGGTKFKIYDYSFQAENYPPDIARFTEPTDSGYSFDKYYQQLILDVDTGGTGSTYEASVGVYVDNVLKQTLTVAAGASDRRKVYTLSPDIKGKKSRLVITPGSALDAKFQLFGHEFVVIPGDRGPVTHSHDWDNLGHLWDKRLETLTLEWDIDAAPVTINMDALRGIAGAQTRTTVATFSLSQTGRNLVQFPIADGIIAKMIRLYPASTAVNFKTWKYSFTKVDYPPDTVKFTDWSDFGYPHAKYVQEVAFDVDTGGVAASVDIEADGGDLQTVSINTTHSTRQQILTLNPSLEGNKFRLNVTPGTNGKFQLFKWEPKFLPADKGPVSHSHDWDDLGWPFDKLLKTITIEYASSGGTDRVTVDLLSGINGTTITSQAHTFTLSGTGRSKQTFSFPADTEAKMIRVRPLSTGTDFKMWGYTVDRDNRPKDISDATEWDDLGWACDKILRSLTVEADTGGVQASVAIQVDGTTQYTFTMTTTETDRSRIITVPSDIIGRRFRLVPTAGSGGKFQLFRPQWNAIKEPCAVSHWDSYEQVFGSAGWKFLKQVWIEYTCAGPVTVSIYRDGGELLHTETLPAQATRDTARFYLPDENTSNGALNKSKSYRFVLDSDSDTPFKFYRDSSRVESMNLSGDQRAGYSQHMLWGDLQKPI